MPHRVETWGPEEGSLRFQAACLAVEEEASRAEPGAAAGGSRAHGLLRRSPRTCRGAAPTGRRGLATESVPHVLQPRGRLCRSVALPSSAVTYLLLKEHTKAQDPRARHQPHAALGGDSLG